MKIGTIDIDRPVLLAPMEDVTDIPFRLICRRLGADVMYTEFVNSDGLVRGSAKTAKKMVFHEEERPIGIQIYGGDIAAMDGAARLAESYKPDLIDINCGCWVRDVAMRGAGAGLPRDLPRMEKLASAVVKAVGVLGRDGYELVEVEWTQAGGRWTLRLFIDREGGVGIDDCQTVSRTVEPILDVEDFISPAYDLEVSSPGLDRPLRTPEHFARYAGQRVLVKAYGPLSGTVPGSAPRKSWTGVLRGVTRDIVLEIAATRGFRRVRSRSTATTCTPRTRRSSPAPRPRSRRSGRWTDDRSAPGPSVPSLAR